MKEIRSIVNAYYSIDNTVTKAALATVVRIEGSSYRRIGARMLVLEDGTYLGGISGGCLEGDVLRKMQKAIVQNKPSVARYDTMNKDDQQIGVGLGCNGIIDVLISPLHVDAKNTINILASVLKTRKPEALISIIGSRDNEDVIGNSLLYISDLDFLRSFIQKNIADTILLDIKNCLRKKKSLTSLYDDTSVLIEIILPVTHLIIYGGNYDIYPLVRLAKEMGWLITVVMNTIKADKSLYHFADTIIDYKTNEQPVIDDYSAVVLMSHDYNTDKNNLLKVLHTDASYIGLLGPANRSERMFTELQSGGITINNQGRDRIFAPAGLDIGASTPEEIALSIIAEIKCASSAKDGKHLREKKGTIYEN